MAIATQIEAYQAGIETGIFDTHKNQIKALLAESEKGYTSTEISDLLFIEEPSIRARITELLRDGVVIHSDLKETRKGTRQISYRLVKEPSPFNLPSYGKTKFDKLVITLHTILHPEKVQEVLTAFDLMWRNV